jgi:ribosome-binding factor A
MAKEKSFKKEKFQEGLVKEIILILRSEIKDSRLTFVSITKVELNKDNSLAKVYWDTFDSTKRGDVKKALGSVGSKIRGLLSSRLKVRHTPSLEFIYDSQFESEKKIDDLLKSEGKKAN